MNEVIKVIKSRRSIRSYLNREISRDILDTIIEAGNWAPTGANVQPWRFVIVQDAEFRQKLAEIAIPKYWKWYESAGEEWQAGRKPIDDVVEDPVYYSAPVIVFVIGTKTMTYAQDCPMVCQNIMLAAWSLGIGSCWVGFGKMPLQDEDVKQALELKENEMVFGPILLGYPKLDAEHTLEKKPPVVKWI
jgi:nitroreductase